MAFRFRSRLKIAPGFYLNVGKASFSISAGIRGAHLTIGPHGVTRTIGLPGTGLYDTKTYGWGTLRSLRRLPPLPTVTEIPIDDPTQARIEAPSHELDLSVKPFYPPPMPSIDHAAVVRRRYDIAIAVVALTIITILAWPYIVQMLAGE